MSAREDQSGAGEEDFDSASLFRRPPRGWRGGAGRRHRAARARMRCWCGRVAPSCPVQAGTSDHLRSIFGQPAVSRGRGSRHARSVHLHSGKHLRSVSGFETPHSIFPIPQTHPAADYRRQARASSFSMQERSRRSGTIRLHPGADSIGFGQRHGSSYVVTGGKDVKLKESGSKRSIRDDAQDRRSAPGCRSRRSHGGRAARPHVYLTSPTRTIWP